MLKPCVGLAPCCLRHHALQHQQTKILTLEPQVVSQELEPVAPPRTLDACRTSVLGNQVCSAMCFPPWHRSWSRWRPLAQLTTRSKRTSWRCCRWECIVTLAAAASAAAAGSAAAEDPCAVVRLLQASLRVCGRCLPMLTSRQLLTLPLPPADVRGRRRRRGGAAAGRAAAGGQR